MDDESRALREVRILGEGSLYRLSRPDLIDQVAYRLEPKFTRVIGMAIISPRNIHVVKVAYPLWNHFTEEEKAHVVAHEHAHLVTHLEFGFGVEPHGIEFQGAMKLLGYQHAPEEMALSHQASSYMRERMKQWRDKTTKRRSG